MWPFCCACLGGLFRLWPLYRCFRSTKLALCYSESSACSSLVGSDDAQSSFGASMPPIVTHRWIFQFNHNHRLSPFSPCQLSSLPCEPTRADQKKNLLGFVRHGSTRSKHCLNKVSNPTFMNFCWIRQLFLTPSHLG